MKKVGDNLKKIRKNLEKIWKKLEKIKKKRDFYYLFYFKTKINFSL